MVNLERICEDIARLTSGNVDPGGSTWKGSAKTLQGLPLTMLILGECQLMVNLVRIRKVTESPPHPMHSMGWTLVMTKLQTVPIDFSGIWW